MKLDPPSDLPVLQSSSLPAFRPSNLPRSLKGVVLALASSACIAVTFIASKQAMQDLSPLAFTPIWFAVASAWGAGVYLWQQGPKLPPGLSASIRPILLLGLLNGLSNFLFFTSIDWGDPTLVAFFSRSETIYSVLLGAWFLGERMRRWQWLGVVIAIAGTGVMTFRAGTLVWVIMGLALASNFFLAWSNLVAKQSIIAVPPLILSIARTLVMTLMLGLFGWAAGELAWPGLSAWLWIVTGAFFGPFLSYVLFYKSLRYLDLSKGAVIRATQPLFVAVYGLALFGTIINFQQFFGGLVMMVGVALMLWEQKRLEIRD
jgi:drug/metabolite transporter (DMT)-like permease